MNDHACDMAMMLAEVGLPEGADMGHVSLKKIVDDPSLGISRYDLLPDGVVFWAWPKAGGASLTSSCAAPDAIAGESAVSVLYGYYNPEAVSEVPPVGWHTE